MNRPFKYLALTFGLLTATMAHADDAEKKSYLFVETADKAELSNGKLILHGVDNEISVFTDRPYRNAGVITRELFADVWKDGEDSFESDPPNAALTGKVDGETHVVILEISSLATHADQTTYDFKLIEGDKVAEIEDPVMFIDGWREPYTGPMGGL